MNRHDEFLKAFDAYPSQDNEGFVPDRGGFKCGFGSAWDLLSAEIQKLHTELGQLHARMAEVEQLRAQLAKTASDLADANLKLGATQTKLECAREALRKISKKDPRRVGLPEAADMAVEFHMGAAEAMVNLDQPGPDTHLLESRAGGLDKAAEICRYHAGLPMRNEASKAMARDIEISCLATAGRIRRGEYENPTSEVMQAEKEHKLYPQYEGDCAFNCGQEGRHPGCKEHSAKDGAQ